MHSWVPQNGLTHPGITSTIHSGSPMVRFFRSHVELISEWICTSLNDCLHFHLWTPQPGIQHYLLTSLGRSSLSMGKQGATTAEHRVKGVAATGRCYIHHRSKGNSIFPEGRSEPCAVAKHLAVTWWAGTRSFPGLRSKKVSRVCVRVCKVWTGRLETSGPVRLRFVQKLPV